MRIPEHIGIIPDGNRRWARQAGLAKEAGYAYGLAPGLELLRLARDAGVREITYYGFTTDNCGRPSEQVRAFSAACVQAVEQIASEPVSLLVVGDRDSPVFPRALLPYGERRKICGQLRSRDVSRVDMVIRWGGMRRLSGFLPVQSVYADFFVVDRLWPDFQPEDFEQALRWYQRQDVTRGG